MPKKTIPGLLLAASALAALYYILGPLSGPLGYDARALLLSNVNPAVGVATAGVACGALAIGWVALMRRREWVWWAGPWVGLILIHVALFAAFAVQSVMR